MKHITTAAQGAGAQYSCVRNDHAGFSPVLRWDVLGAVKRCRRELGLSTGDLVALEALVSFLPLKDRKTGIESPALPDMLLVVFASNVSVCSRANHMDERILRRHISRLTSAGLITRKDSASGKRYARRIGGEIVDAYGVDLRPMFARSEALIRRAAELDQIEADRRSIRSEAVNLRATLLGMVDQFSEAIVTYLNGLGNVLRRASLTLVEVLSIRDHLGSLYSQAKPTVVMDATSDAEAPCPVEVAIRPSNTDQLITSDTDEKSGADGRNVRDIESTQLIKKNKKASPSNEADQLLDALLDCNEVREMMVEAPRTMLQLRQSLVTVCQWVGLRHDQAMSAMEKHGPIDLLRALEQLLKRLPEIRHPAAWLAAYKP